MGDGAALLAEIAPELRASLPDLPRADHPSDSEEARFRLFDAMSRFVRSSSRERPLLLILDDIQWADEPSLLLLHFVARNLCSRAGTAETTRARRRSSIGRSRRRASSA